MWSTIRIYFDFSHVCIVDMGTYSKWKRCWHGYVFKLKMILMRTSWNITPNTYKFMLFHVQPIPPGVTFSNAVSKLKAQSFNVSFHWNVAKETFELWALSFENVTPLGIGCTWILIFLVMSFHLNSCWCSYFVFNLCVFHCNFFWQAYNKTCTDDINSCKQANRKRRCVGETKTITNGFKMLFFRSFVTCHERATAWLFHVGARQNYCVSHLSSRRSDGGLSIQMSYLKDKPNMRAVGKGEGHTRGRRSAPQHYTYLCPVNIQHTLSCLFILFLVLNPRCTVYPNSFFLFFLSWVSIRKNSI